MFVLTFEVWQYTYNIQYKTYLHNGQTNIIYYIRVYSPIVSLESILKNATVLNDNYFIPNYTRLIDEKGMFIVIIIIVHIKNFMWQKNKKNNRKMRIVAVGK